MLQVLIGIALKSLLIAGLTLGLLQLMKRRSAAERSWVAHIGLFALVVMALAPVVLPRWNVETPALFASNDQAPGVVQAAPAITAPTLPTAKPIAAPVSMPSPTASTPSLPHLSTAAAATALYAVPAALLLIITFVALARLIALQARAEVLVDGHWLSALARAQRRMGFKHGTALLTSDELASPISWGLMRPVIVLNSRAVEATGEAEAIIAHELAHVARMDWVKLLLARIATALFWFNPLVWLLAREAHQLREETADDSVLAADIVDTDYAQLLVGVARHECPGLLLGAHGVAPSKSSLARRVARVLDGKSVRGPVARSFALGVFAGAILVAAPLAALTLTPATNKTPKTPESHLAASEPQSAYYPARADEPTDIPSIIARGVSTSVTTAVAAATAVAPQVAKAADDYRVEAPNGATVESVNGTVTSRAPTGATVTVYAADGQGRRKIVARAPNGATAVSYVDAKEYAERERSRHPEVDRIIELKAVGVTPEYVGAMRAAVPRLSQMNFNEFTSMKAVGVTPEYARNLVGAFPSITVHELVEARAVGITGDYIRAMRAAGVEGDLDDYVQLRAVGVDPAFAARVKASGVRGVSADDLVEMKALGTTKPPAPPRAPAPPRGWNPDSDDGG